MDLSQSVLVVVDMQRGFVHPNSQHVVPTVVGLVDRWAQAGGAMVFTRYFNWPGSPFEQFFQWSALMTSPQTDLIAELEPWAAQATMLDKNFYTMFNDKGSALVAEHGWTDLFVCGLTTESCVLKTVADAFERSLTPWLITDASATHAGPDAHEAGLLCARRFVGASQLITTSEIELGPGEVRVTKAPVKVTHHIDPS